MWWRISLNPRNRKGFLHSSAIFFFAIVSGLVEKRNLYTLHASTSRTALDNFPKWCWIGDELRSIWKALWATQSIYRWKRLRMEERIKWEMPPGSRSEPQLWITLYVKAISTWNAGSKFAETIKTGSRIDRERRDQFQFGLAYFLHRSNGSGNDKCFSQLTIGRKLEEKGPSQ